MRYMVSSAWSGSWECYRFEDLDEAMRCFSDEVNNNVYDVVKLWKFRRRCGLTKKEPIMVVSRKIEWSGPYV